MADTAVRTGRCTWDRSSWWGAGWPVRPAHRSSAKKGVDVVLVDRDELPAVPAAAVPGRELAAARRGRRPAAPDGLRGRSRRRRAYGRRDRDRLRGPPRRSRRRARAWSPTNWCSPPAPSRISSACPVRANTLFRCTRCPTPCGCSGTSARSSGRTCSPRPVGRRIPRPMRRPLPAPAATLSVIVVGGGPTGVETSGALGELFGDLKRAGRLRRVHVHRASVDHGKALLGPFSERAHRVRARQADRDGRDDHVRRRRDRGRPTGRRCPTAAPWTATRSSGPAASPPRRSPRAPAASRGAAAGSTSRRTCPSRVSTACTRSATWRTSPTGPGTSAPAARLRRAAVGTVGSRQHRRRATRADRPRRSTTGTRGSWR